jgi:phospholipase C
VKKSSKWAFTALANIAVLGAIAAMNVSAASADAKPVKAATPIKHIVVILDENESFDHYFGTYPFAKNVAGEPPFYAAVNTPSVNGLTAALLINNPNLANPKRLDRSQAHTKDFDHGYTSEQKSFHGGLMDRFVQYDGHGDADVMDYYDGNTVTAYWNFAQHFVMNDNYFGSNLGPSTSGAINVISGNTHGVTAYSANAAKNGKKMNPGDPGFPDDSVDANGTLYGDADPYYDYASEGATLSFSGRNLGDLLNAKGLTWGCFFGGYDDPTATHKNIEGEAIVDYIPHHEPFQYYSPTSNIKHNRPSSVALIGHTDQANHQYDLTDFWSAAESDNLPNYSFLKACAYQDGHPSYSDPLDEQRWLVETVNRLESLPSWKDTAIFLTYDDSDGWYDHVMPPIVNQSQDPSVDALEGDNAGTNPPLNGYEDRLGYGPRLPMILVSPYAKHNAVSNTLCDQSSVVRFVEENWNLGHIGDGSFDFEAGSLNDMFDFSPGYNNPPLFLNPDSGEPVAKIAPFKKNGKFYMALPDFAQSLDVQPHKCGDATWFTYGNRLVNIPSKGDTVTIDMKPVLLGAQIVSRSGSVCLPIDNLIKALGVAKVEYKQNQILFKRLGAADPKIPFDGKRMNSPEISASTTKFFVENVAGSSLSVKSPIAADSPAGSGVLMDQFINGVQSGKAYNLIIKAVDSKGKSAGAGSTVYVTFATGNFDKAGTLKSGNTSIGETPMAITLDSKGEAELTYTVDAAPTNWDAYDNDEITITTSTDKSAPLYADEISIYS